MIRLQKLSLLLGGKLLLANTNLEVYSGQKWGVIGSNGAGKSTLFKLLLGQLSEDSGLLELPKDWRIAHMVQEIQQCAGSALDYVLDGDIRLREIQTAIEQNKNHDEQLAQLYQAFEDIDGYSAESRALKLLNGLGFQNGDERKAVNDFSGGWRIRLNLAQALMCPSDLLLLDEPTNHLDLDACFWLESWLKNYRGTLLIISHDRDFLDNVVENIVNFENTKLISYTGNYSAYEKQKAERLAQQQANFEKQQERISEIENFVRRFKAKASKAKQAQSRVKELQRMELIAPAHIDSPFTFRFPQPARSPQTLLTLHQAAIGYEASPIVKNIELNISGNSRLGILGHNGEGKSTLLKTLAQDLPLLQGELHAHEHLKLAYFSQHQIDALDLNASPLLHLQRLSPKASEQEMRTFLGAFGFQGDRVFENIQHFSGGEKARLALSLLAWKKPNLLILDEPTNHLDLEVRHALTMALQSWDGAIILVSHDRHLLKNTVDDFFLVDEGKLTSFDGDLDDYHTWLLRANYKEPNGREANNGKANNAECEQDKKSLRKLAADRRNQLRPLKNEIKSLESKIEKLHKALSTCEAKLADENIYQGNNIDLQVLLEDQGKLRSELELLETMWLSKTEEFEQIQGEH